MTCGYRHIAQLIALVTVIHDHVHDGLTESRVPPYRSSRSFLRDVRERRPDALTRLAPFPPICCVNPRITDG